MGLFGLFWVIFRVISGHFSSSPAPFGTIWGFGGEIWGYFAKFGVYFDCFCCSNDSEIILESFWGRFWSFLVYLWIFLEPFGVFGVTLRLFCPVLGLF